MAVCYGYGYGYGESRDNGNEKKYGKTGRPAIIYVETERECGWCA